MKKYSIFFTGILLLVLCLASTGCTFTGNKKLNVRLDDKIIKSVRLDDADRYDVFKSSFNSDDLDNSLLVEFGKKIYLDFGDSMPDRVVIQDSILTPTGEYMYNEMSTIVFNCGRDENGFYFVVDKNLASAFSSVFEEGRNDLRGFMIRASLGNDEIIYGFVIKTKATI